MEYCLGTVQFGINYGIQGNGRPNKDIVYDILNYSAENGVNLLDTATAYGDAETVLGGYFETYPEKKNHFGIVSKLPPDAFEGADKLEWPKIAVQNARDGARRIGVQMYEAYLFHNASYIYEEKAVEALFEVKKTGLTKRIGVSIYSPKEAMKALEYPEIEAIQIPYNLFDRRLDKCGFFLKAKEHNVEIYARSSLLQGLVLMDPSNLPEKVSFAEKYIREFEKVCKEFDANPLETAVGYVGDHKDIDYVVFGVDNMEQLKEYLAIKRVHLPAELKETIDVAFRDVEEKLVNPVMWR